MLTRLPAKIGCLLLLTTVAFCIFVEPAFCQIIPANRLPTWQGTVGVPGGIPNRTTIYKTESAGASESTIQADLNSCPSNQVVLLSAGTYTFTSTLTIPSYVTLRGAGMGSTIINASSVDYVIKAVASFSDDFGAPVVANHVSWTSGYAQNTSALTLSANNLAGGAESVPVGNIVMIDQLSDANCDASGGYGLQGVWWSIASPTSGADRYQHEIAYVTAKNGHTITIDPPIRYANYTASSSPQVWFEASSGPVKFAGIENLSVHNTGGNNSTHGIGLQYSYGCWILNCGESNFRYGLSEYFSVRCEIRHCAIGGLSGSGDDYDFSLYYTGGCLFEDNVVTNFDNAFLLESCIGDAFTYNYTTNTSRSAQGGNMTSGDFASHGGNNAMNLLEGNNFIQVSLDNGWGSAFGFVLFRNRIQGWDPSHTAYGNYVAAIDDYSMNRNMTFVGNVLGTSGKNTVYESQGTGNNLVFLTQLSISGVSPSPDPAVESSMVRAMNWTSATTTNGGLVSAGYTSADLPASLLYSSKPTYFGNLAWPPVDPTNPTYSSSITNIPAGYRQVYKTDPPSGGAVANQPPVATASATPTSGQAPLAVSFSSAGSSDPEGATLTYSWNFGDTMSSTSANPSHTYSTPGTYSASLTVSDGTNSTTSTPLSITVNAAAANQPPVAVAAGTPTTGAAPLNVTFSSAGSYDPEGAGLSYYWDFGDGTNSTAANPTHTYSNAGNYLVQLTVSDGTNATTVSNVTINVTGLIAAFGFEATSGNTVLDAATGVNDGTVTNATLVPGMFGGNSLLFNGSNSVVSVNNSMVSALTSNMTIEAWVNPGTVRNAWMPVVGKALNSSQLSYVVQGVTPQNGVPASYVAPAADNLYGSSPLPTNTWSHIAVTYNGSSLCLYVNGLLVSSQTQSGAPTPSSVPLTIGSDGLLQAFWSGKIDEVRIYNTALSATKIQADMTNSVELLPPPNFHTLSQ